MKILTGLILAAAGGSVTATDCEHRKDLSLELNAERVESFRIDAGAGSLTIRGTDGETRVRIAGIACASDPDMLEDMRLVDESRDDRLAVRTDIPEHSGGWFRNRYARIDLEIEVPAGLRLDIEDGSGSIELDHVGDTRIDDGSGSIRIRDALGNLEIDDGSGGIHIVGVAGNLVLEDGSGEIEVEDVAGFVTITDDGSGEIEISGVGRDVAIGSDGSGSIEIDDVTGDVIIDSDGSGSIEVRDVRGSFEVGRDGSGGVRFSGIDGEVRIPGERWK